MMEIICINHILGKCPKCWSDEKNKQCGGYKPIMIFIFEVKEGEKDGKQSKTMQLSVNYNEDFQAVGTAND